MSNATQEQAARDPLIALLATAKGQQEAYFVVSWKTRKALATCRTIQQAETCAFIFAQSGNPGSVIGPRFPLELQEQN